jgi:hypothetical protein
MSATSRADRILEIGLRKSVLGLLPDKKLEKADRVFTVRRVCGHAGAAHVDVCPAIPLIRKKDAHSRCEFPCRGVFVVQEPSEVVGVHNCDVSDAGGHVENLVGVVPLGRPREVRNDPAGPRFSGLGPTGRDDGGQKRDVIDVLGVPRQDAPHPLGPGQRLVRGEFRCLDPSRCVHEDAGSLGQSKPKSRRISEVGWYLRFHDLGTDRLKQPHLLRAMEPTGVDRDQDVGRGGGPLSLQPGDQFVRGCRHDADLDPRDLREPVEKRLVRVVMTVCIDVHDLGTVRAASRDEPGKRQKEGPEGSPSGGPGG